jgi:hypothetical protein
MEKGKLESLPSLSKRYTINLVRFLGEPKNFSGVPARDKVNPLNWLKKLERLKEMGELTDKEILLITANHLTGKASIWFDVVASKCQCWSEFILVFKRKHCSGLEDTWWNQIRHIQQEQGETVEDVDVRLRELFSLVGVVDEKMMIRTFLGAINPDIAHQVEGNHDIAAGSCNETLMLEKIVAVATRLENMDVKYQGQRSTRSANGSMVIQADLNNHTRWVEPEVPTVSGLCTVTPTRSMNCSRNSGN